MNLDILWNNFLLKIKEHVSALSYETWFQDTKLVSSRDNIAVVIVPMELHKKHLMENYQEIMENTLKEVNGSNFTFKFVVEEEGKVKISEEGKLLVFKRSRLLAGARNKPKKAIINKIIILFNIFI